MTEVRLVLDTSALNVWVAVLPEPREPPPPVKALGETKEAPPPEPRAPPPERCHPFALIVTSGALTLPGDQLRAVGVVPNGRQIAQYANAISALPQLPPNTTRK